MTTAPIGRDLAARSAGSTLRSVEDAAAQLDRIARHCVFACDRAGACVEAECAAWRLEQAAADYLVANWIAPDA